LRSSFFAAGSGFGSDCGPDCGGDCGGDSAISGADAGSALGAALADASATGGGSPASAGFRATSSAGRSIVTGFRRGFCGPARSLLSVGSFTKSSPRANAAGHQPASAINSRLTTA
jgi:hypothetical protein